MNADSAPIAIVTGAGRGIGRAAAVRLASDGFHVIATDVDGDSAAETEAQLLDKGLAAGSAALDVTDRGAVFDAFASVAERHGRIDAVVNNAMWIRYEPLTEVVEATIDRMVATGLKALVWTIQAAYPTMIAQGHGAIINVSSPAAVRGVPGSGIYSAVKGAVSSLTWQASGELGRQGIRVNAVVPGAVPTEGARQLVDEEGYRARTRATPLGRLGRPEEIAAAIAFLASEDAAYINGHLLTVDGGLLAA